MVAVADSLPLPVISTLIPFPLLSTSTFWISGCSAAVPVCGPDVWATAREIISRGMIASNCIRLICLSLTPAPGSICPMLTAAAGWRVHCNSFLAGRTPAPFPGRLDRRYRKLLHHVAGALAPQHILHRLPQHHGVIGDAGHVAIENGVILPQEISLVSRVHHHRDHAVVRADDAAQAHGIRLQTALAAAAARARSTHPGHDRADKGIP